MTLAIGYPVDLSRMNASTGRRHLELLALVRRPHQRRSERAGEAAVVVAHQLALGDDLAEVEDVVNGALDNRGAEVDAALTERRVGAVELARRVGHRDIGDGPVEVLPGGQ